MCFRNKDEISRDSLNEANLIVFGSPREEMSNNEISDMIDWLNSGGRVLLLASEGDTANNTSLQKLLDR